MENKEKNNYYDEVTSCHVSSRPSLFKTLEVVQAQVQYEDFARQLNGRQYINPIYKELCLIIAEILVKPPDNILRIRGSEMEVAIVQEVYRALQHEHIELVADNFSKQTHLIHKKTSYLQTALYNVYFEFDAHYTNLVKHDMGY